MNYTILYRTDKGDRIKKHIELDYQPSVGNYLSLDDKLYRINDIEIFTRDDYPLGIDGQPIFIINPPKKSNIILYCSESKTFDLKSRKHLNDKFEKYTGE